MPPMQRDKAVVLLVIAVMIVSEGWTDGQMDHVSAGVLDNNLMNLAIAVVPQISVPVVINPAVAIGVLAENINAVAQAAVDASNTADVAQ